MAVRINPCHGCPAREGCKQREEFRRRVSGLGLRSATFRCDRLAAELRRGRRVLVPTPCPKATGRYYDGDGWTVQMVAVPATITNSHDGWFSCVIDPGRVYGGINGDETENTDKYRFRRRMRAARIVRFLDEPDRAFCEVGARLLLPSGECDRPLGEWCECKQFAEVA